MHYTRVGSTGWSEVKTPGVIKSINIAGLVSGSEYYFRIEAKSEGVKGRMSDAIFFKTDKLGRGIVGSRRFYKFHLFLFLTCICFSIY